MPGNIIAEHLQAAREAAPSPDSAYALETRNLLSEECFQLIEAGQNIRAAATQIAAQSAIPVTGRLIVRWVRQRYPVDAILYAQRRTSLAIANAIGKSFGLAEQRAMNTMMLREINRRIQVATRNRKTAHADLSLLALMAKRLIDIDTLLDKRGAALDEGLFREGVSEDDALTGAQLMEETKAKALVNFEQTADRLRRANRIVEKVEGVR